MGGSAGQEAGAQGMGAEVGRLEPNPLGIGLHDAAHALIGEPLGAEPAALGDGAEQRTFADAGGQQPCLDGLTGQVVTPRAMAIVSPWPSWSVFDRRMMILNPSSVSSC